MDVGVGYFHDPENVAGLAHFLEHMLFLGSKKYPKENEFESFIQTHGGSNNAYTSMENTNFYFDILPADIEGGLDRFAQFFISPTLGIDNAKREMNAVNSEHRKNIESDGWRSTQIKRHVASKATPYSKFGTGSIETLGSHDLETLQGHLRSLWERYYTAGNMRLVVLGAHPLRDLARMVESSFMHVRPTQTSQPIISRNVTFPDFSNIVYDASFKTSTIYFAPVRRIRSLTMQWAIPSQASNYTTNPGSYIGHLLEADGKGTLASQLRKKGWITGIQAGVGVTTSTFSLFQVELQLTSRGMRFANEIAEAVFQGIHRIRARGLSRWRYNEMARMAKIQFNWKGKERPMSFVSSVAARMRWYNKEHWVSGSALFYRYESRRIKQILDALIPSNVVLFLSARSLEKVQQLNRVEPHYGIKYTIGGISKDVLDVWNSETKRPYLFGESRKSTIIRLPEPNKWIPSKPAQAVKPWYDLRSNTFYTQVHTNSTVHIAPPMVIYETARPAARVWFRQDGKFRRPIVHANVRLWTNGLQATPRASALTLMYVQLVNDLLQDWSFAASNAGYDYSIRPDREGITITMVGYGENLESYFKSIAYRLSGEGFRPKEDRFYVLRERALEALSNTKYQAPYKYARTLVRLALGETHPLSELASALNLITLADVVAWPTAIFTDCRMEAFFNGNIYPWEARSFAKAARTALKYQTTSTTFAEAHRHIQQWKSRRPLLDGRYTITTPSLDQNEPNSMVYALFQTGPGETIDRLYMQILDRYLHKPAYNQLRTKEQLGYIVWALGSTTNDVQELVLQVQTTGFAPKYVSARIQTFLANFRERLNLNINPQVFAKHVMTLYETKLTNSTTLVEDTKSYWGAILSQRYNFLQRFIDAQLLLKKVTLGGFLNFVDRTLGYGKYSGASITFEIYAKGKNDQNLAAAPAGVPPHAMLPAPLPSNDYTDRLRRLAAERVGESLQREGKLSDYLRKDSAFRHSEMGRKILKELLARRAQRDLLRRNVLQHLEHRSIRQLKVSHGYRTHEQNCTIICAKVTNETRRPLCVNNCVARMIQEENERIILSRKTECIGRCQKVAAALGVNANATKTANCTQTCENEARDHLRTVQEALRKAKRNERSINDARKERDLDQEERNSFIEADSEESSSVDAETETTAESQVESELNDYADALVSMQQEIVTDQSDPAAVVAAAYQAGHQHLSKNAINTVSFLETDVEVDPSESMEVEAEDQPQFVEAAEQTAAEHLAAKDALLAALEKEAFQAGLAVRARIEREAANTKSLAETGDVPSTMYQEEGEEAYKRMGFDKFEKIADPREEMEAFGRPKVVVEDIRDRVFRRYANMTQFGSRFHYDGSDTDAPVAMTIQFSPYATKTRQLSVATLSSLRHTLFLAPLRVKTDVPVLVPVPRQAPSDARTLPLLK